MLYHNNDFNYIIIISYFRCKALETASFCIFLTPLFSFKSFQNCIFLHFPDAFIFLQIFSKLHLFAFPWRLYFPSTLFEIALFCISLTPSFFVKRFRNSILLHFSDIFIFVWAFNVDNIFNTESVHTNLFVFSVFFDCTQ